ncbi:MAG: tyrosine-type recombinase/integrase [Bacteroidota bacterium]
MKQTSFFQYLEFEKRFSPHTILAYKSDLSQFLDFLNSTYELTDVREVRHAHVRSWIVDLIQQSIKPRSIKRKLSALKTYFKFLLKRGHVEHNPMLKVLSPQVGKRLPVFVQKEKMSALLDQTPFGDDYSGCRDKLILEVLYSSGLRRSELIGLQVSDLDFHRQQLKVLGKGGKERLIPFGATLARSLKAYLQLREETFGIPAGSLFLTNKGKPLYPKFVYKLVQEYLSSVTTVEQRSPHVLRHSFATHLSDNGADLNAIKELLGHANLAATQIYTHNSIERLKEVYRQAHPKSGE